MKKHLLKTLIVAFVLGFTADYVSAQTVGISDATFTPNTQAVLDLSSNRRGFLPPRLELNGNDLPISGTKPAGLMVYNQGGAIGPNGFYYWTGSAWTQVASGSDVIHGSGTLNYLSKWTPDGSTLGNSQLFDNGTNVGINNSSPAFKLDVRDDATGPQIVARGTGGINSDHAVGFIYNTSSDWVGKIGHLGSLGNGWSLDMWTDEPYPITFWNSSLERMRIASDGKVGIGTTTPATSLNVFNGNESSTLTNFTQSLANGGLLITTDYTNGAYTPGIFWNTTNDSPTMPKAGIFLQETTAGTKMLFGTSTTYSSGITSTGMVLNDLGRVGIGTLSPNATLHAAGNAGVLTIEGNDHVYIQYYPDGYAAGRKAWIGYGGSSDDNLTMSNEISGGKIALSTNSGNVVINSLSGSGTRVVMADASGNLSASNDLPSGDGDYIQNQNASAQSANFWISGDGRFNGDVDIAANREIFFADNGQIRSLDNNHRIFFDRSNNLMKFYEYGDFVYYALTGTETMRLTSGGNLGIGSPTPAYKLDIVGGSNSMRIQQNGSLAWTSGLVINGPGSDTYIINENTSSGYTRIRNTSTGQYGFTNPGGTNNIWLNANGGSSYFNSGNFGIKTTSPSYDLDVSGNTRTTGDFYGNIHVDDTRSTNDGPNQWDNEVGFDFKSRSTVGVPGSGTYSGMMTIAPWGDNSGDANHQINFNEGGLFWRQGQPQSSSWDGWKEILTSNGTNNSAWSMSANFSHSPDDWCSGCSGAGSLPDNQDDYTQTVTMPFSITIDGTSYNQLSLCTNGWIAFGSISSTSLSHTTLPSSTFSGPVIFPYWDDLRDYGSGEWVRYGYVGSTGNRTYIVDYSMREYGSSERVNFQVQIHEGSGLINVKYRDTMSPSMNGQGATIGFQVSSSRGYPIVSNGKVLDDNRDDSEGWSVCPVK